MNAADLSAIDQRWIQQYCDQFMKVAEGMPEGPFKQSILKRVDNIMDLVQAWQKRNTPIDQRT